MQTYMLLMLKIFDKDIIIRGSSSEFVTTVTAVLLFSSTAFFELESDVLYATFSILKKLKDFFKWCLLAKWDFALTPWQREEAVSLSVSLNECVVSSETIIDRLYSLFLNPIFDAQKCTANMYPT